MPQDNIPTAPPESTTKDGSKATQTTSLPDTQTLDLFPTSDPTSPGAETGVQGQDASDDIRRLKDEMTEALSTLLGDLADTDSGDTPAT